VTGIPIAADKLSISRTGEHNGWLVFESHDAQLVFPDSSVETPYRLSVQSVTHCEGVVAHGIDVGFTEHYDYHPPPRERYVFKGGDAAYGRSKVFVARGKRGVRLRWHFEHATTIPFGPVGKAAVWIHSGPYRFCALFPASTVVVDRPGRYLAKGSLAPASCDTGCPPSE